MKGKYYAICLAAAFVMLGAAIVPSTSSVIPLGQANGHGEFSNDAWEDHNETGDNETEAAHVIGGGGWFMVVVDNVSYKDTFGMSITENDSANSSFVFQGRDASIRVHSLNFTGIDFSDNNTTASARGWCTVNGNTGFWFSLKISDNGTRSDDVFQLSVYKDKNRTGDMDEDTPTWQWIANGLGGGQIGSSAEDDEADDSDDDEVDEDDEDDEPVFKFKTHGRHLGIALLM